MPTHVAFEIRAEPLPPDVVPISFEAHEEISTPYAIRARFSTLDPAFKASSCLRKGVTVAWIDGHAGRVRTYSGVCEEAAFVHHDGRSFHHEVVLRAPVSALGHRQDSRIFQDKSVVDIVKEVLSAGGIEPVDFRLSGQFPKREIVVQYRETALDFIHRLLEDEGIFYFFEHQDGLAKMVFADSTNALDQPSTPPVVLTVASGVPGASPVTSLSHTRRLRTTSVMVRDFDFEKPQVKPQATKTASDGYPMPYYEWPAGFTKSADGERKATARLRELRRDADVVRCKSRVANVEVGKTLEIEGAAQEVFSGKFVVLGLVSRGAQSQTGASGDADVENEIVLQPEGASFAAERRAPRPRIRGLQTATVTGPTQGEEQIHCDKYGRIKVRFHWDRVGQYDDKSSAWVRVALPPMGGQLVIPRVGWEVAVAFIHGDPDKPIVVGRVYNAERVPPYALPGAKTSGAIKSASSPGGAGVNEIKMGDSGGGQGFDVSAQKDMNVMVGNDQNETIAGNEQTDVKVNASHSVSGSQTTSVGGNQQIDVGAMASAKVGGGLSISVGGNSTDNAISNYVEKVGASRSYAVGGNMTTICNGVRATAAADIHRSVGSIMLTASVGSIADEVAASYSEKVGAVKVDVCKGNWAESVGGSKSTTAAAAEIRIVKGAYSTDVSTGTRNLVGGLHYQKVAGDYSVSAPMIALVGAVGIFKGGGSELKLGGGPVVLKGSAVSVETALLVKLGGSLKIG
jgi:type VI secretion system secreted protein VgrG